MPTPSCEKRGGTKDGEPRQPHFSRKADLGSLQQEASQGHLDNLGSHQSHVGPLLQTKISFCELFIVNWRCTIRVHYGGISRNCSNHEQSR
jgi:hypothetical protein